MKRLKANSKVLERIIAAEQYLDSIGITIGFSVYRGISITDKKSGMTFRSREPEDSFPRSIESEFILEE